jgi:hypothetical protein
MRKQLISSSSNPTLNTNSATPVHEGKRPRLIYPVDEGHRSQQTAAKYKKNFQHFQDYIRIHDEDVLLDLGREAIQELVMKYTLSLPLKGSNKPYR